jgi:cytochrome c-type biogenesis protein CcmF
MFWVTLLAHFGSVAVYVTANATGCRFPWVVAVISTVEMFFLFLMVVQTNPSIRTSRRRRRRCGAEPAAAELLHGESSAVAYLGFVGMTIPFAFGMAALISGQLMTAGCARAHVDDDGVAVSDGRPVTRRAVGLRRTWLGRLLGLGSGGERRTAAVVHGTALLHSVIVQERRGMLKVWNVRSSSSRSS